MSDAMRWERSFPVVISNEVAIQGERVNEGGRGHCRKRPEPMAHQFGLEERSVVRRVVDDNRNTVVDEADDGRTRRGKDLTRVPSPRCNVGGTDSG